MVLHMQKLQLTEDPGRLLLSHEVQDRLRISRATMNRWIASGKLPVIRIEGLAGLRFREADVLALLRPSVADDEKAAS
jgi:excisionase family DNA binding protein